MIKQLRICDFCGREEKLVVGELVFRYVYVYTAINGEYLDLCGNCYPDTSIEDIEKVVRKRLHEKWEGL